MKVISVFGSSKLSPDAPVYTDAIRIGRELSNMGYTIMNGGYGGIMAAVSEGASLANGQVIGVVSSIFPERLPNQWITQLITMNTFKDRLFYLIENADAYLIFPGGIGTLCEVLFSWNMLQTRQRFTPPIVIYGQEWKQIFAQFEAAEFITEKDMAFLRFIPDQKTLIDYFNTL